MQIQPEGGVRHGRQVRQQSADDRERVDVGSQALAVNADHKSPMRGPWPDHSVEWHDVRMRDHGHRAGPLPLDLPSCLVGQGDQFGGRGDQLVQIRPVGGGVHEMRVGEIVDGHDQRNMVRTKRFDPAPQTWRVCGVKSERQVYQVEPVVVCLDPSWLQHSRRPPLTQAPAPARQDEGRSIDGRGPARPGGRDAGRRDDSPESRQHAGCSKAGRPLARPHF